MSFIKKVSNNACEYDLTITYNNFDKLTNEKKYEIFDKIEFYQINKNPYCFITDDVTVYSNHDTYETKLGALYKNNIEIYNTY